MSSVEDAVFGRGTIVPEYNMYDVGGNWNMTTDVALSFGMDNIFDEQPPMWDGAVGAGQFNTDGSTYDQLGRQFRIGLRWKH